MSSTSPAPTDSELQGFLGRLREYRSTLSERDQALLNAMVAAAIGRKPEPEDDVHPFWVAYHNPVGPAGGPGYGTAVAGPYGAAAWGGSPWGAAYGARVW